MAEADTETSKKEEPGISAKTESKGDRPSNLCCYSQRTCNLEKLKGFDFCHKHILEDKASPFKPCDFVAKSNERRCPNPAPKLPSRGKSFCIIHTRKAELRRAVEERRKRRRQDNVEGNYNEDDKGKRRRTSSANSQRSDKLDGHSSEDDAGGSGEEYLKVDSAWHGGIDSDADSVDSEEEDPLKHAGVWTTEEATRVCRDKMIRLRLLYIAQFKRLQHVLKERQRKYCQAIQAEEEEESGECHLTPTQLLGHKQQHERPGTEALLHRQAKEKRLGTTTRQQNMAHLRCTFSPGGNRCSERVLPLTKHCIKHITHDPNQLLYQKCSFPSRGDSPCDMNAPKIFTHTTCRLHLELPTNMKRPHIKKDLLDAKERAKARRAAAVEAKEGDNEAGLVPEALQQKSSALIPPAGSSQSDDGLPVSCQSQASTPLQSPNVQSTDHIKMEVDDDGDEKAGDSESTRTVKTTQSSSTTLKSESTVTASESISPGLAAASLVVVCSSPQLPVTGMPLASTSGGIQQSSVADSKLGTNARQEGGSCVSSVVGKYDANAKDSPIIEASDLKAKVTPNKPKETTDGKTVSSDVNSAAATGSLDTSAKLAVNTKAGVNVVKQETEKTSASKVCPKSTIPHEALQGTSLNCPPGTSQVSHQQQSAPKVTSQVSLKNVSESASQIPSHASSQTTSQAPLQVASQSASQASSQTASRAPLQASSQSASQVLSQAALQSATQASSQTASQTALQPSSQSASQALSQAASQGASQSSQIASQGPSQAASQSASHGSSHGVTQHLLKSTSQVDTKLRQAPAVSSASSVNPSKSMPTTGPSTVLSPAVNSPKPPAGDESSRMLALKDFKHLPSGMTASTSKQYGSMITGHSRESLNKDSKTEKGPA